MSGNRKRPAEPITTSQQGNYAQREKNSYTKTRHCSVCERGWARAPPRGESGQKRHGVKIGAKSGSHMLFHLKRTMLLLPRREFMSQRNNHTNGASFYLDSILQVRGQKITTINGVLKANTIGSGGKSAGPQAKSNDEPESVSQVVQRERKCPSTPPILPSPPTPRSARVASKPTTRGVASK